MEDQAVYNIENYTAPPAMQSPEIGKLAEALAKAQSEMSAAKKDAKNPFFKSDYSTLQSCIEAGNPSLNKNGLSVAQLPGSTNGEASIDSLLMHSSGQWIRASISVKPDKGGPQALGSCLTYLRRYSYQAITGQSSATDDDAESATDHTIKKVASTPPPKQPAKKAAPKKTNMKKFIEAVTPIAEKMGPEVFDAFMTENNVKSLDELTNREAQTDFYNKLKAA
jgi:hypothetical protein